ncbi:DUF2946 family protein [Halopseudomonas aestusnigri]|uniref:DUF2946 domain-containing protein n=1 Tax=Halopseudomonas aestusnigri TaxID=857252 RepID=A0AAQ1GA55_9GAMM|nr:DUF2946 family protein [Halopseudomonas aestusnigri]OWL85680.1 hypothetical protein B7O88_14680 [Halopseudomonas aestusnigri]SEG63603.1 Protein of unknown function [Halopseudomonas aestusnigri]
MLSTNPHRSLFTWLLYISILLNVPTCGLLHGQMLGMQLSGVGVVFCSIGNASIDLAAEDGAADAAAMMSFSCPVCGSVNLAIGLLFVLLWLRFLPRPRLPMVRSALRRVSPRCVWPPANPRASPLF